MLWRSKHFQNLKIKKKRFEPDLISNLAVSKYFNIFYFAIFKFMNTKKFKKFLINILFAFLNCIVLHYFLYNCYHYKQTNLNSHKNFFHSWKINYTFLVCFIGKIIFSGIKIVPLWIIIRDKKTWLATEIMM